MKDKLKKVFLIILSILLVFSTMINVFLLRQYNKASYESIRTTELAGTLNNYIIKLYEQNFSVLLSQLTLINNSYNYHEGLSNSFYVLIKAFGDLQGLTEIFVAYPEEGIEYDELYSIFPEVSVIKAYNNLAKSILKKEDTLANIMRKINNNEQLTGSEVNYLNTFIVYMLQARLVISPNPPTCNSSISDLLFKRDFNTLNKSLSKLDAIAKEIYNLDLK